MMTTEEITMTEKPEQTPAERPTKQRGRKLKYETGTPLAGRPPRSPKKKVGQSYRFLTTIGVKQLLVEQAKEEGIKFSGQGRLMLYLFLILTGKLTQDLLSDGTFEEMRSELANSPVLGELVRKYQGKELVDKLYETYHAKED